MDDDRAEEARRLLRTQIKDTVTQPTASTAGTPAAGSLPTFFRAILLFDIVWYLMTLINSHELSVPPPDEARAYFLTLSLLMAGRSLDHLLHLMKFPAILNAALAFLLSLSLYSCFAHVAVPMDPTGNPEYDSMERHLNSWLSFYISVVVVTAAFLTAFLEYRRTKRSEAKKTHAAFGHTE